MKNAALTDTRIKAARCGVSPLNPKNGKPLASLTDGRGLYLKLMPSGAHSWRFDFVSPESGKRQTLVIGSYPDVTLEQARKRAQDARNMLAEEPPRCPVGSKRAKKEARKMAQVMADKVAKGEDMPGSFKAVALECLRMKWRAEPGDFVNQIADDTADAWTQRMEAHVFPTLGARQVPSIKLREIIACLEAVPSKTVGHAMKSYMKEIFGRAKGLGLIEFNIASDLNSDMGKAPPSTPRPALTSPGNFARLLRAIDGFHKQDHTDCLKLASMLWQRPANMAAMKWADLDLDGGAMDWIGRGLDLEYEQPVWVIPAAEMKRDVHGKLKGRPHLVPLPAQAVAILKQRLKQRDPLDAYVFPSSMKEGSNLHADTINSTLKDLGFQNVHCFHGFRASARTILGEMNSAYVPALEMNLAHSEGLANGVSYSRGIRLEERAGILKVWADYLDVLKVGNVTPIKRAA